MSDKKLEAIENIRRCWGVSDSTKFKAIELICRGASPSQVVEAIEQIRDGLGFLTSIEEDLNVSSTKDERLIEDYEVRVHGMMHEQYFQGCEYGIFDDLATGIGNTAEEAFDDALECLAQNGWNTYSEDLRKERERIVAINYDSITELEERAEGNDDYSEHHFYVSVLVR